MNNASFPNCSVCLDILVAPVTTQCGHTTCITCYSSLTGRCPECRAFISSDCKLNIVLDQVLSNLTPDYDILKTEKMKEINRKLLFGRYIASERYETLVGIIRDKLRRDGEVTLSGLTETISESFRGTPLPLKEEILFLLSQIKPSIVKLSLSGETHYIYRGDLNTNHIIRFATSHRDALESSHLYILASSLNSEVAEMFNRLNLCPSEDIHMHKNIDIILAEFLSGIDLTPRCYDDDEDEDTETDSDSD